MSSVVPNKRPAPVDIQQQIAEARKRAAEVKARLEAAKASKDEGASSAPSASIGSGATATAASTSSTNGSGPVPSAALSARERVEALKARVAAAAARAQGDAPPQRPPPLPSSTHGQAGSTTGFHTGDSDDFSRMGITNAARGGLAVGIHPALLADNQDRGKSSAQKSRQSASKLRTDESSKASANPYLSEVGTVGGAGGGGGGGGGRARRTLNFTHNLHARPAMQAANEMRRKAALEQMKKRIQVQAAKAGLDESTEIQAFAVPMPPDVEFWDEGLQSGVDDNELISRLIVHPILIEPPQEKFITLKPKPLMLTKTEQKKMRRIRRAEEHREEQAKIRLGLAPTPAPKIKHSNVMRVYGEMAVKDPTAVEAMVNKQVAERVATHLAANADRQLSKEAKAEKMAQKAEQNAAMGLNMCVFRIALGKDQLLGKHRYKIDVNAKQFNDMTGVVIVAPSMSLCLVEGGEHAIRKYKHLMLHRVQWKAISEGNGEIQNADQDQDQQEDTTCTLLWQGQIRDRKFKKWGSFREVETETQAKDALTRAKMENFWTLAKNSQ